MLCWQDPVSNSGVMKLTNDHNLPPALMVAAMSDDYDKGEADISVTELIGPARHRVMEQRHYAEITQDVSMRAFALLGDAVHHLMEHGDDPSDVIKEERLFATRQNWTISGQIDRMERTKGGFLITDYKLTSVQSVMNEKPEWAQQVNLYRWLVHENEGVWPRGQIIAFLRDWSKRMADMKPGYPNSPVVTVTMPSWKPEKIENFLASRLTAHQDAQALYDLTGEMVECSPHERWSTGTRYAVLRQDGQRAIKIFDTVQEARNFALSTRMQKQPLVVETRHGEERRCEGGWCLYADFCDQWQEIRENREMEQMLKELE